MPIAVLCNMQLLGTQYTVEGICNLETKELSPAFEARGTSIISGHQDSRLRYVGQDDILLLYQVTLPLRPFTLRQNPLQQSVKDAFWGWSLDGGHHEWSY